MQPILFPDVEAVLVSYLSSELTARGDTASAHVNIPNPRPERFVVVPRIGGTRASHFVDQATIAVECWADRPALAHDLAQLVRALIHALPGKTVSGVTFYRTDEFAAPANLPDPESNQARYVLTVSVSTRGTAI